MTSSWDNLGGLAAAVLEVVDMELTEWTTSSDLCSTTHAGRAHAELLCVFRDTIGQTPLNMWRPEARRFGILRDRMVDQMNRTTEAVLAVAVALATEIQASRAGYVLQIPSHADGGEEELTLSYRELPFHGDVLTALQEIATLRQLDPLTQHALVDRLIAEQQAVVIRQLIGGIEHQGEGERSAYLKVLRRDLRAAERSAREFANFCSKESIERAISSVEELTRIISGAVPMPAMLFRGISFQRLALISRNYELLSDALRPPIPWIRTRGRGSRALRLAWRNLEDCALAFRVVTAWIRGIAAPVEAAYCQLCYRHAVNGSRRCALHICSKTVTRAARLAAHIQPVYLEELRRPKASRRSASKDLVVQETVHRRLGDFVERGLTAAEARRAISLWLELARYKEHVGAKFEADVDDLFWELVSMAGARACDRRRMSDGLLNLKTFYTYWLGPSSLKYGAVEVRGRNHDEHHPVVTLGVLFPQRIRAEALRQRAWHQALDLFNDGILTKGKIQALQAQFKGASLSEIAAKVGRSHMTLYRIMNGHAPGAGRTTLR